MGKLTPKTYGWAGQILRVDLSAGSVVIEPIKPYGVRMLGGRGIGQRLLFNELAPSADPLGPDNKVVLSAGPLVGTLAPGSGRLSIDWKNVQTGGIGSANLGGHFAPELKYAGFDSVVIEGQAKKPVFLYIRDGEALGYMQKKRLKGKVSRVKQVRRTERRGTAWANQS